MREKTLFLGSNKSKARETDFIQRVLYIESAIICVRNYEFYQ